MRHRSWVLAAALWLLAGAAALAASEQTLYTFDANGNLTSKTEAGVVWTYRYDSRDQLTEVRRDGVLVEVYRYDYAGRRVERAGAGGLRRYVWDEDRIVLETDNAGNRIASRTYAVAKPLAYEHQDEGTAFVLLDLLGSPTALLRSDGSVAGRTSWGAWGERRANSGASFGDLGYTGYQTDPATGLCYARARFYDPSLGRFLSEDPLEGDPFTPPSLHRYVYAFDNPTIYVDRDGRCVGDFADSEPCLALKRAAEAAWNWFKAPFESGADNADAALDEGTAALAALEGGLRADRYSAGEVEDYLERGYGGTASAPALRKLATAGERIGAAAEHAGEAAIDAYSAAERLQIASGAAHLARRGGRMVARGAARELNERSAAGIRVGSQQSPRSGTVGESSEGLGSKVVSRTPTEQETRPAWLARAERGTEFNKAHRFDYPWREVYVEKPGGGYVIVDAYDPIAGEIVSRKLTQLRAIREETAIGYLSELSSKYPPGARIANVPSSGPLAGQFLVGRQVLEIPIQTGPVPERVLLEARRLGITIRDVAGRTY